MFDLAGGYDFGQVSFAKGMRLSLNVTNVGHKRYASNLDSSVFAPSDPAGKLYVFPCVGTAPGVRYHRRPFLIAGRGVH